MESVRCRDGSGINVHKKGKGGTNPTYHPRIISRKFYLAGVPAAATYVWILHCFMLKSLSRTCVGASRVKQLNCPSVSQLVVWGAIGRSS